MPESTTKNKWLRLNKPIIVFSVLVIYIFASFIWWSYLLITNNKNIMLQSREILYIKYGNHGLSPEQVMQTEEYRKLEKQYKNQVFMVIGEGMVFMILLSAAIFQIWRSYRHELQLANQQRNFLLSITHELKSPLASIKLGLETIKKRDLERDAVKKITGNALQDTERLQQLVQDILLAAKFDDHSFKFVLSALNFSLFVNETIERIKRVHPERKIIAHIADKIIINGDNQALTSLVSNIIENALKYSGPSSEVTITLAAGAENIILQVADEGIGIPDHEKEQIFKKFYRVGHEDTRKTKGTGLGLYIVKEIAEGHLAKIIIEDNQPKGSIFKIMFPFPNVKS
jgi:two-component system, OmpR family, phosphate regulon sensor histidine kinase PhoR